MGRPVLGTDLNDASLERARQASYSAWSLRGCSELARSPYLSRHGDRFHVAAAIRDMVTFAPLNLVEDVYPSPFTSTDAMDLVVCRNVLLYFDRAAARSVVRRLCEALVEDGRLVVSQVEAGIPVFDGLVPSPQASAVYRKTGTEPSGSAVHRKTVGEPSGSAVHLKTGSEPSGPVPAGSAGRHRQTGYRPSGDARQDKAESTQPREPDVAGGGSPYEAALRLWHAGQEEEALRLLEAEVGRDPAAAPPHYLQGLILLDVARPDEALAAFRRCTCADPAFAAGHLAQAGLLARAGFGERARIALRTAVHLVADRDPDDLVLEWDRLTVRDVLDLASTQRRLLASAGRSEVDCA